VSPGDDGTVQVVPVEGGAPKALALKDVTELNPPPVKWTGSIVVNALVTRGNSESENLGASANAVRRTEIDRLTLGAGYYYGRQRDNNTGVSSTSINNWFVLGKYDFFLTRKFYLYAAARVERDIIAELDLRVTAGGGVGYQWFETPTLNLNTEAGLAWIYENFSDPQPSEDHLAARLAYHVDWTPHKMLKLFHNLEYLPRVTEPFVDYNLNLDAGLRATVIQKFLPSSSSSSNTTRRPRSARGRKTYATSSASGGRSDARAREKTHDRHAFRSPRLARADPRDRVRTRAQSRVGAGSPGHAEEDQGQRHDHTWLPGAVGSVRVQR
jgi:putative salt-induced outer membrane protein YdiY